MCIDPLIFEAKAQFGLSQAGHELIRHNENITCKINCAGKSYVLRIRHPFEHFSTALINSGYTDAQLMQGEIDLIMHLRKNGIKTLQMPVANVQGNFVSILSDGSPAMLLTWVEGRPITKEEAGEKTTELAEMVVRIHHAANGFRGIRPSYDEKLLDRLKGELYLAQAQRHLSESVLQSCICALNAIKKAQIRLKAQEYGLIHADLGLGNILVTEYGLVPIDFSLAGYAPYAQETGMLIGNFSDPDIRRNILANIRKAGETVSDEDADLFLSLSVLLFIATQHKRYYKDEWFSHSLDRWANTLFIHHG